MFFFFSPLQKISFHWLRRTTAAAIFRQRDAEGSVPKRNRFQLHRRLNPGQGLLFLGFNKAAGFGIRWMTEQQCDRGGRVRSVCVRGGGSCRCWRLRVGLSTNKIYSSPDFPFSLPQATGLLQVHHYECVCYFGCLQERSGGRGVITMRPGSLPTKHPGGEKVTVRGRQSPVTSNALLTPDWKEGHQNSTTSSPVWQQAKQ